MASSVPSNVQRNVLLMASSKDPSLARRYPMCVLVEEGTSYVGDGINFKRDLIPDQTLDLRGYNVDIA